VVPPPPVLNQIISLIHHDLLRGPVLIEIVIETLRESNQRLYTEMKNFLQVSGRSLFDAFRKVGLVQNQDGSWSAPSGLPDFEVVFNGVADAFTRSVFQFLDAKKCMHKNRPAFITASGQVMTATGVLFCNTRNELLMQAVLDEKTKEIRLDDFGGKVDEKDPTVLATIQRESVEETNKKLPEIFDFLGNLLGYLYIPSSKYLLLICRSPVEFEEIDLSLFGTSETHSSIQRTVRWVRVGEFLDAKKLHPRLFKSSEVKDTICKLFQ
jgi:hypothetical protein